MVNSIFILIITQILLAIASFIVFLINKQIIPFIYKRQNYHKFRIFLYYCIKVFGIFLQIIALSSIIFLPTLPFFNSVNNSYFVSFYYTPTFLLIGLIFDSILVFIFSPFLFFVVIISYIVHDTQMANFLANAIVQIFYIVCLLVAVLIGVISKKNKTIFFNAFVLLFVIVFLLIVNIIFVNHDFFFFGLLQFITIPILYILMYFVTNWFNRFWGTINLLSTQQTKENKYFYNYQYAKQEIESKIHNEQIQFGLVMIFNYLNFDTLLRLIGIKKTKYIKNELMQQVYNSFQKFHPIFFITPNNEYACFIKLDEFNLNDMDIIYQGNYKQIRSDSDPLKSLQHALLNIPRILNYKNITRNINTSVYASIYGIHSNDLDDLIFLAYQTRKQTSNDKKGILLDVYNPQNINVYYQSNQEIVINQYFNPNNLQIRLDTSKKHYLDYEVSSIENLLFDYHQIRQFSLNKNIFINTSRLVAMTTLKFYSAHPKRHYYKLFAIDFPINYLLFDEFNFNEFRDKLHFLGFKMDNLLLKLDLNDFANSNYYDVNPIHLYNLRRAGCKILFKNFQLSHLSFLKIFQPDYIILNNQDSISLFPNNFATFAQKLNIQIN